MNVICGQQGQAAWALQALTEGNAACREDFKNSNGIAALTGLLRFPEQWNWTPAVGTLKNVVQGERPMTDALLAEGAVPVLVDLLTFGRPILQVWGLPTMFGACPVGLWPALWVCGLPRGFVACPSSDSKLLRPSRLVAHHLWMQSARFAACFLSASIMCSWTAHHAWMLAGLM